MNSEMIADMKEIYAEYLLTEKGQYENEKAFQLALEWDMGKEGRVVFGTANVNPNRINKKIMEKSKLIKIIPIGLNNLCHSTSSLFEALGFECKLGFNITSCMCSRKVSYELHSVNKKDGVLYDFTEDFNGEKEKWFLEMDTNMTALEYMKKFGRRDSIISIEKNKCVCKVNWNDSNKNWYDSEFDLLEKIKMIENM